MKNKIERQILIQELRSLLARLLFTNAIEDHQRIEQLKINIKMLERV